MISENTQAKPLDKTAVKCRFFAQYWEQKVLFFQDKGFTSYTINAPNMFGKGVTSQLDNAFLKLKHISKITDKEAKQLPNREYNGFSKPYESAKQFSILFDLMGFLTSEEADILRRLGFAIPFDKYSVEDLISFGWVRLV